MSIEKHAIRRFSKEYDPAVRKELARNIREVRAPYFVRNQELDEQLRKLVKQVEQKEIDGQEAFGRLEEARESLARDEATRLNKFFGAMHRLFKIIDAQSPRVREGKRVVEDQEAALEEIVAAKEEFLGEIATLSAQKENRQELDEAREMLAQFYRAEGEKYEQYLREEMRDRDVRNVMEEHGVFFVHGILPDYVPDVNSLIEQGTDWKTKLKAFLTLEPTASCSTVRVGDDHSRYWSWVGVLLNRGIVMDARGRDAATRAVDIKQRTKSGYGESRKRGKDLIYDAIYRWEANGPAGYNELTVRNPGVAGFYFNRDVWNYWRENSLRKLDIVSEEEVMQLCASMQLPLFIVERGNVYPARLDEKTKRLIPAAEEKATHHEVLASPYVISPDQKEEMLEDVMETSPFKVGSPEMTLIDTRNRGREYYFELVGARRLRELPGEDFLYDPKRDKSIGWDTKPETPMRRVGEVRHINKQHVEFFVLPATGQLFRRCISPASIRTHGREQVHIGDLTSRSEQPGEYIMTGKGTIHLGRAPRGVEGYLEGLAYALKDYAAKSKEWRNGEEVFKEIVRELAYHAYGFADQAESLGDVESAQKVRELARKLHAEESYQEVVRRRVTEKSAFRLTKEDLRALGAEGI